MAFHPGFATNRRLFLHWSDLAGDTRVAEFRARPGGRTIDPEPVKELLFVKQPEENHNGGQLAFGPDNRLYLGLGDGGGAFDPGGRAQQTDSLLGKVIAVDVEAEVARWDPVLVGLRNPWRFSFDPALAELWVADVGQDSFEEVNRVSLELDEAPKNLGWSAYEGHTRLTGAEFGDGELDIHLEMAKVPQLTHIGEDADGEFVFASASGSAYRAVPAADPPVQPAS